jgi:hypothetical protein
VDLLDAEAAIAGGLFDPGLRQAEEKTRRLARLYHNTLTHGWDGREVLKELTDKHGPINVPVEKREALGRLFSVLMWGELAAWNVAADLARTLPETDAKMAVTGQVFDEARHFLVMREYLRRAEIPVGPLNPFSRRVMVSVLSTSSMVQKLYGMQLTVELLALSIFKLLQQANIEPVLTDLLTYIERDEARHVGLGVLYLPRMLKTLRWHERLRMAAFSVETFFYTMFGGKSLEDDFLPLGISPRELAFTNGRMWDQMMAQIREAYGIGDNQEIEGIKGLSPDELKKFIDFVSPADLDAIAPNHRRFLDVFGKSARWLSRLLS